jgi:hypothetical protein
VFVDFCLDVLVCVLVKLDGKDITTWSIHSTRHIRGRRIIVPPGSEAGMPGAGQCKLLLDDRSRQRKE